ncbi:MAG: hypothetical protein NT145_04255, partial [Elusimicrobia bacterium]|nr:hypothetical protein [Elusimicrobiota bacterium]
MCIPGTSFIDHSQDRTGIYTYGINLNDGVTTYAWDGSLKKIGIKITYDNDAAKNTLEVSIYGGLAEYGKSVLITKIIYQMNNGGTATVGIPVREDYTFGTNIKDSNGNIIASWDGSLQKTRVSVAYPLDYSSNIFSCISNSSQVVSTPINLQTIQSYILSGITTIPTANGYKIVNSNGIDYVFESNSFVLATLANNYINNGDGTYTKAGQIYSPVYFQESFANHRDYIENYKYSIISGEIVISEMTHSGTSLVNKSEDRTETYQYARQVDGTLKSTITEVRYTEDYSKNYRKTLIYSTNIYLYGTVQVLEMDIAGLNQDALHLAEHSQDRNEIYTYIQVADGSWRKYTIRKDYIYTIEKSGIETYSYSTFSGEVKESRMEYVGLFSDHSQDRLETYTYARSLRENATTGDLNGNASQNELITWDGSLQKTQVSVVYTISQNQSINFWFSQGGSNFNDTMSVQTIKNFGFMGATTVSDGAGAYKLIDSATGADYVYKGSGDLNNTGSYELATAANGYSASGPDLYVKVVNGNPVEYSAIKFYISLPAILQKSYTEFYGYVMISGELVVKKSKHISLTSDQSENRTETYLYSSQDDGSLKKTRNSVNYIVDWGKNYIENYTYGLVSSELVQTVMSFDGTSDNSNDRTETYTYSRTVKEGAAQDINSNGVTGELLFLWDGSLQKTGVQTRYTLTSQKDFNESFIYGLVHGSVEITTKFSDGVTDHSDARTETYTYDRQSDGSLKKTGSSVRYNLNWIKDYNETYIYDFYGLTSGELVQTDLVYDGLYDNSNDRTETYTFDRQSDGSLKMETAHVQYSIDYAKSYTKTFTYESDMTIYNSALMTSMVYQGFDLDVSHKADHSQDRTEAHQYVKVADGSWQTWKVTKNYDFNRIQNGTETYNYGTFSGEIKESQMVFIGSGGDNSENRIETYLYTRASDGSLQKTQMDVLYYSINGNQSKSYREIYTYCDATLLASYHQLVLRQLRHEGLQFSVLVNGIEVNYTDNSQNRTEVYGYGTTFTETGSSGDLDGNGSDGSIAHPWNIINWDGSLQKIGINITYDNDSSKNVLERNVYGGASEYGQTVLKTKITTPAKIDGTVNTAGIVMKENYFYDTSSTINGNSYSWDGSLQKTQVSVSYDYNFVNN